MAQALPRTYQGLLPVPALPELHEQEVRSSCVCALVTMVSFTDSLTDIVILWCPARGLAFPDGHKIGPKIRRVHKEGV